MLDGVATSILTKPKTVSLDCRKHSSEVESIFEIECRLPSRESYLVHVEGAVGLVFLESALDVGALSYHHHGLDL